MPKSTVDLGPDHAYVVGEDVTWLGRPNGDYVFAAAWIWIRFKTPVWEGRHRPRWRVHFQILDLEVQAGPSGQPTSQGSGKGTAV